MNVLTRNTTTTSSKAWICLGLMVIIFFLGTSAFAQNTKGDRPSGNRENRFKIPSRKGGNKRKSASNKRIKPGGKSLSNSGDAYTPRRRARGGERPGKPIRPVYSVSKPSNKQKAWRGDLTGRRIRTKESSSSGSGRNVFPQTGRYVRKTIPDKQRVGSGRFSGGGARVKSRTGKTRNVFSQRSIYVNNRSSKPHNNQQAVSNRSQVSRLKRLQANPSASTPPGKKRKVVPRSASRSYIARKSINVYANFHRPKRKTERAYTKDLAGKPLRTRNFESQRPGIITPTYKPYAGRKRRVGDRPYTGPSGGYRSATRPGERAWTGDVAKRRIRHRDRSSKRSVEGIPVLPRRYRTATRPGEKRPGISPLPPKPPGLGAERIGKFQGNIKGRRTAKGGGSISGKLWNNNGTAIPARSPSRAAAKASGYPGKIKRFEISPGFNDQGEEFSGYTKARRPKKGGGSVSGKLWNNKEQAIQGRSPGQSVRASSFQGNIKMKRQAKGGGSVSGRLWNNDETAIPVKTPPARARKEGRYPGNIKRFQTQPGFLDQGEEFTGYTKLPKFKKGYVQNKNAAEESVLKKRPDKTTYDVDGLQIKIQRRSYVKNKNTAEEGQLKLKPTETTHQAGELQIKVKRRNYVKNPNSAEDALLKLKPTKATLQTGELQVKVKQYPYKHNPNSAEEALKVREPGKAFARATDYQGNIKMQKFKLFEKNRALHPDAKFVKTNKNNVAEEKDMLTNFKLWWARLFKKQETQPDHLKEKGRKPRYDKGEQGMWNE